MSPFKWTADHSVYLPEIDAEHRAIFRIGDELHKAIQSGAELAQLKPILANLVETADQHFRQEERLMRAIRYPAFAWHKRQHDTVRKSAKALVKRIDQGDPAAPGELLHFLAVWLRDHMSVSDRMMSSFLRNYLRSDTSLAS